MVRLIVFAAAVVVAACAPPADRQEFRLGTAALGGAYYPLGQGLASLVTRYADGISMVPIVTRGALENPRLVSEGELEMALTNADLAYFAYRGEGPYDARLDVLAAGALHPSVLHLIARAGGSVPTFAELRGRRLAIGPAGGPTVTLTDLLLQSYGMTLDDVVPSFLSYSDGFTQLGDGNVDAAFALAGYPAAAVMQTRATQELAFIHVEDSVIEQFVADNPYYYPVDIPAGVYDTESGSTVLAIANVLIVRGSESDEAVYEVVESIYANLAELSATNAIAGQIDASRSVELPLPLHPGAARYFAGQ
ncbi:MAG: TAXI family TRAP transporter solute-binding subunit [Proteobacteria bacterium]|nr:TAXI family TRAP transporter solute-binding subunit [Pseudomonadota bacterium]